MKPNELMAINLKKHFERNDINAHALGKSGAIPQETVWSCLTGTIVPSVNTVHAVCDAVHLDASILARKEFEAEQIRHSKRVGLVADDLMTLSLEQINFIADVVKGLRPDEIKKAEQAAIKQAEQAAIEQAEIEWVRRRDAKANEVNRQMTLDKLKTWR